MAQAVQGERPGSAVAMRRSGAIGAHQGSSQDKVCVAQWRGEMLAFDCQPAGRVFCPETGTTRITARMADSETELPSALVVPAGQRRRWEGYAMQMAQQGLLVCVFECEQAAMRWVSTQAAIFSLDDHFRSAAAAR